jgi:uncharacterized membrane protein
MKTIAALFERFEDADSAIHDLQQRDVEIDDISVLARDRAVQERLRGKDTAFTASSEDIATADVSAGAGTGAFVGGLGGLLIGLSTLAIPSFGEVYAIGALAAIFSSTVAGTALGAMGGGLLGALAHWGVPEEQAATYAEGIKRGGILVAVQTSENSATQIKDVFHQAGALDIDVLAERLRSSGWNHFDETTEPERNYPRL